MDLNLKMDFNSLNKKLLDQILQNRSQKTPFNIGEIRKFPGSKILRQGMISDGNIIKDNL